MSRHNRERRDRKRYGPGIQAAIAKAQAEGKLKPGTVQMIDVVHEDYCAMVKGIGRCDCYPMVKAPVRVPHPEEN